RCDRGRPDPGLGRPGRLRGPDGGWTRARPYRHRRGYFRLPDPGRCRRPGRHLHQVLAPRFAAAQDFAAHAQLGELPLSGRALITKMEEDNALNRRWVDGPAIDARTECLAQTGHTPRGYPY